jgi:hypothetical protein
VVCDVHKQYNFTPKQVVLHRPKKNRSEVRTSQQTQNDKVSLNDQRLGCKSFEIWDPFKVSKGLFSIGNQGLVVKYFLPI